MYIKFNNFINEKFDKNIVTQIENLLMSGIDYNIDLAKQLIIGQGLERFFEEKYKNLIEFFYCEIHELFEKTEIYIAQESNIKVPKEIGMLKNITRCDFRSCKNIDLSEIVNIKNLEHLNCHNCYFTEIPSVVMKLKNIKTLKLTSNRITKIPKDISKLTKLECFDLDGNDITEIPLEIAEMKDLIYISLQHNKISDIEEDYFDGYSDTFLYKNPLSEKTLQRMSKGGHNISTDYNRAERSKQRWNNYYD